MKTSESFRERKRESERGSVELGGKGRKKQRETEDEIV